ncbi:transcriptional regulator [Haloarcula rubripromontorii]|uniref:(S)-8-amino-7-oxononanoate synthase BioU n=1 Tax=Haloarcula rubripromontorii TaxID=1705562 RepID=A0A0N0BNW1_9EURY|nr:transcriptional regulator [Haloarcula rubripromontorii]KOX93050.1 transcriptional regulator [Haloarcula rubripromontorii]NLV06603.1 transcriptional regulator [Haloarcula rubripromontorii]
MDDIRFAVLGTGGIGRRTLEVSQHKDGLTAVAACDRNGVAIDHDGLDVDELLAATEGNIASGPEDGVPDDDVATDGGAAAAKADGVKQHGEEAGIIASEQGKPTETPIDDIIDESDAIDAVLLALPNLEHDFIPRVAERFAEADYEGVMIDVLKRSRVIGMLDAREETLKESGITFVCGAGATPGFLTGAAALAAQSFVEVEEVEIWWGVGLKSGYEDNRGTVREDIAHLDGYDIETAREMSEAEIEALIDEHDGVLEFHDMEHADDVLLERAGICDAEDVHVGGVLDVRSDEKPTTTTVSVTGTTFDGETGTNTFELDDVTSMEANVNGPALGYLKAGVRNNRAGHYGVFGPADLMPGF